MSVVGDIMTALAGQLADELGLTVDGLNVYPRMEVNPTPPALDVYPADPFIEQTAFRPWAVQMNFIVRARVTTADHVAGQNLLLEMMDPDSDQSVNAAIAADRTLGGYADNATVAADNPSGFGEYRDAGGEGSLLGCQWTVNVQPAANPPGSGGDLLQEDGMSRFTLENGSGSLLVES